MVKSEKQRLHLIKLNSNQKGKNNRRWKGGILKSWSQGLTKETDERIKKGAKKLSITRKQLFKENKFIKSKKGRGWRKSVVL